MINGKMHCVHIKLYHMYILCDKLHWKCVTTHISTQDWLRFFNYELKWTSFILYFQKNYQKKKMIKLKFYNLDITKQFDMMNKLKSEQWKEWNVYITKFIIIICIHNYYCSNSNNYSRKKCIQKKIQHKL